MQVLTERRRFIEKNPTIGEPILRQAPQPPADHAPIALTGFRRRAPGGAGVSAQQIEMSDAED